MKVGLTNQSAGMRRQRVLLYDVPEATTDGYGQPSLAATPIPSSDPDQAFAAYIRPLSGSEILNIRQIFATATHLVEIGWLGSTIPATDDNPNGYILPHMKLKITKDNRILNIDNAYNVEERNICWVLTCTEKIGATS